jgi:hypothetical protein
MLFATSMLLNATVGWLFRPVFSPAPPTPQVVFGTVDIILIASLLYDRKMLGRPHDLLLGLVA